MLPRTGSTLIGELGLRPGMVPAPASEPFSVCAYAVASIASAPASANAVHLPSIAGSLARRRLRRNRHGFQLLAVLRIHRLRTTARGVVRNPVVHAEFVEIRIGPRQEVWNDTSRPIDFGHHS